MDVIERWHAYLRGTLSDGLESLLDDDVVFYSPIVYTPQVGKALATMYLSAARQTLPGDRAADPEASPDTSGGRFATPSTSWTATPPCSSSRRPWTARTSTGSTSSAATRRSHRGVPRDGAPAAGRERRPRTDARDARVDGARTGRSSGALADHGRAHHGIAGASASDGDLGTPERTERCGNSWSSRNDRTRRSPFEPADDLDPGGAGLVVGDVRDESPLAVALARVDDVDGVA